MNPTSLILAIFIGLSAMAAGTTDKPAYQGNDRPEVNAAGQQPDPQEQFVYVTPKGKKYHRASCRYAATGRKVKIDDATAGGYSPCNVCNP